MPRRARLCLPGIPWHIVQRGNNRLPCFDERADYFVYLNLLEELAPRFHCEVHALVLMTNHIHLLLTPGQPESAGQLMKHLGQRYTQYFNRRCGRVGTLWQGRYHSCLAQTADYVLACYRYIEMNPVRAGMVKRPDEYPWSSYATNALGKSWPLISPQSEYLNLGLDSATRLRAYGALFTRGLTTEMMERIRGATLGNVVLGDKKFAQEVETATGRRSVHGSRGRPRKIGTDHIY